MDQSPSIDKINLSNIHGHRHSTAIRCFDWIVTSYILCFYSSKVCWVVKM